MDDKTMQRRRISAYEFAIWELEVFLDTHPDNRAALETRMAYRQKRDELIQEYEAAFGPYILTSNDVNNTECWTWLDNPWPWEYEEGGMKHVAI